MIRPARASASDANLTDADPASVADRYEIERLLGRGGMASIYRAHDTVARRAVALKLLTLDGRDDKSAQRVELFEREFHTLTQLAHPRVVQAFDYVSMSDPGLAARPK